MNRCSISVSLHFRDYFSDSSVYKYNWMISTEGNRPSLNYIGAHADALKLGII